MARLPTRYHERGRPHAALSTGGLYGGQDGMTERLDRGTRPAPRRQGNRKGHDGTVARRHWHVPPVPDPFMTATGDLLPQMEILQQDGPRGPAINE